MSSLCKRFLLLTFLCVGISGFLFAEGTTDSAEISWNLRRDTTLAKYRSTTLYNANAVAKELLRMERYIKTHKNTAESFKDSVQVLVGALVWYANLQDVAEDFHIQRLLSKLDASYNRLNEACIELMPFIMNFDFFAANNPAELEDFISPTFRNTYSNGYEALKREMRNYWDHIKSADSVEDLKSSTLRRIDEMRAKIKVKSDALKILEIEDSILATYVTSRIINNEVWARMDSDPDTAFKKVDVESDLVDIVSGRVRIKPSLLSPYRDSIGHFDSLIGLDSIRVVGFNGFIEKYNDSVLNERTRLQSKFVQVHDLNNALGNLLSAISSLNKGDYKNQSVPTSGKELIRDEQIKYAVVKEAQIAALEQTMPTLRMPSESEMIEAIAIYLAKRVKQESVMWFFETIQKNAKNYELLQTFFPGTITLLQSNEIYDIPNLGAQWRYALSKDFVRMPRNVLTSDWFRKWWELKINRDENILKFLVATYDVCDYLNQQYSYTKMVEKMYLALNTDGNTGEDKITPATIFSVLYAFNQECFVPVAHVGTDSMKTRPMHYEDYRNISKDELEVMMCLMDMKFGRAFTPIWKNVDAKKFLEASNDPESFRRWAGSIEAGISQFNKIQLDYVKMTNEMKEGKKIDAVYSIFNVWDNLNGLLNIIADSNAINNEKLRRVASKSADVKKYTTKAFEIYNQISLKNYAGAIGTTISLVEELMYTNDQLAFDNSKLRKVLAVDKWKTEFDEIIDKYTYPNGKETTWKLKLDSTGQYSINGKMESGSFWSFSDKILFSKFVDSVQKNVSVISGDKTYFGKTNVKDTIWYSIAGEKIRKDTLVKSKLKNDTTIQGVTFSSGETFLEISNVRDKIAAPFKTAFTYEEFRDSILTLHIPFENQFRQNAIQSALIFEKDRQAIKLVRRLAGFLNDVMLTTEPKQLAKVVESYALPPGSYKRKRNSWFSVDLNAYVGLYGGVEKVLFKDPQNNKEWAMVYGVTAPIGISLSRTFGNKFQKGDTLTDDLIRNPDKVFIGKKHIWKRSQQTLSLAFSIIDVGAVVSYQFSDNDAIEKGLPQEVKWEQVLSPGVKLGYGIPGTPLVASVGWQYTPKLRSIMTNPDEQYSTHRFFIGVLFDLPLANLYQQSYRKSFYVRRND